jgi:hypothetical protein
VVAIPSEEVLAVVEVKKGPHPHGAKSNKFTEQYFKSIKIGSSKYSKTCKVPGCTKRIDRFPFPSFFSLSFLFFPSLPSFPFPSFFSLSFLLFPFLPFIFPFFPLSFLFFTSFPRTQNTFFHMLEEHYVKLKEDMVDAVRMGTEYRFQITDAEVAAKMKRIISTYPIIPDIFQWDEKSIERREKCLKESKDKYAKRKRGLIPQDVTVHNKRRRRIKVEDGELIQAEINPSPQPSSSSPSSSPSSPSSSPSSSSSSSSSPSFPKVKRTRIWEKNQEIFEELLQKCLKLYQLVSFSFFCFFSNLYNSYKHDPKKTTDKNPWTELMGGHYRNVTQHVQEILHPIILEIMKSQGIKNGTYHDIMLIKLARTQVSLSFSFFFLFLFLLIYICNRSFTWTHFFLGCGLISCT